LSELSAAGGPFWRSPRAVIGGAVLIAAIVGLSVISPQFAWDVAQADRPTLTACGLMLLAGGGFAVLVPGLMNTRGDRRLMAVLGVGLALRLVLVGSTPIWEDDFHRYLWDGAAVARGLDPYAVSPLAAATAEAPPAWRDLAAGRAELRERVNYPQFRTIYPGVAQVGFAAAAALGGGLLALRVVFLAAEAIAVGLLLLLLRRLDRPLIWAGLYWLNPLALLMFANAVHVDALLAPLIVGACLAMAASRRGLGSLLIGLAAGVKLWPILLWPLLIKAAGPVRPGGFLLWGGIAGGVAGLSIVPLVLSGLTPDAGLVAYAEGWIRNSALHPVLFWISETTVRSAGLISRMDPERTVRVLLALTGGVVAVVMAIRAPRGRFEPNGLLVLSAVILTLSPAQYPWYWAAILPVVAMAGAWRTAATTAIVFVVYHLGFILDPEAPLLRSLIWVEHLALWSAVWLDVRRPVTAIDRSSSESPVHVGV